MDLAWADNAEQALNYHIGWLFLDEDGDPDIPGWLGDAWREHIVGAIRAGATLENIDWPWHWSAFAFYTLPRMPEWRAHLVNRLAELEATS
jgi:hypothetical protein